MPTKTVKPDYATDNMRLVGHSDQDGRCDGVQIMVHRGYAYIGHIFSKGFSVVDVRDPTKPNTVKYVAAPSLQAAGVDPAAGYPRQIAAGDGSVPAFQRIREKQYQLATVAEPLHLHGWQCIDEMNRALAGQPPSGYVAHVHLFINANIDKDGGAQNIFDPDNGYKDHYKAIWGVK